MKKLNLGEKEAPKMGKRSEKTTFRTLFFVEAITLRCESIAFRVSFDSFYNVKA